MTTPPADTPAPSGGKRQKEKPAGLVIPPPKPKLSKAERRALQEQQRAAKAAAKSEGGQQSKKPEAGGNEDSKQQHQQQARGNAENQPPKKGGKPSTTKPNEGTTTTSDNPFLGSHLSAYMDPVQLEEQQQKHAGSLHPVVLELGRRYATGEIRGSNARCRAMLECFRTLIRDFTPSGKKDQDVRTVLDQHIMKPSFTYWTKHCRPHSVTMGNAFTFLKAAVASLDRDLSVAETKKVLLETINAYETSRIKYAGAAIAELACNQLFGKNKNSKKAGAPQVFLIYGFSEVVTQVLVKAQKDHFDSNFHVIVVDSRPLNEGQEQLNQLLAAGITNCTYVLLSALSYVLPDVTTVLLGASALMSDGSAVGRVGTAAVALAAHANHTPVLFCSETYKISNRGVQLESLTHNELGKDLFGNDPKNKWKGLNLLYDLTPAKMMSGIFTDMGLIPPSSVAVLLREMSPEQG